MTNPDQITTPDLDSIVNRHFSALLTELHQLDDPTWDATDQNLKEVNSFRWEVGEDHLEVYEPDNPALTWSALRTQLQARMREYYAQIQSELPRYADGGYPLWYLDRGETRALCPKCATEHIRDCSRQGLTPQLTKAVNWEDPNFWCEACDDRIESAYAEPEEDSETGLSAYVDKFSGYNLCYDHPEKVLETAYVVDGEKAIKPIPTGGSTDYIGRTSVVYDDGARRTVDAVLLEDDLTHHYYVVLYGDEMWQEEVHRRKFTSCQLQTALAYILSFPDSEEPSPADKAWPVG